MTKAQTCRQTDRQTAVRKEHAHTYSCKGFSKTLTRQASFAEGGVAMVGFTAASLFPSVSHILPHKHLLAEAALRHSETKSSGGQVSVSHDVSERESERDSGHRRKSQSQRKRNEEAVVCTVKRPVVSSTKSSLILRKTE